MAALVAPVTALRRAAAIAGLIALQGAAFAAPLGSVRLEQLPQAWHDELGHPVALTGLGTHRVVLTMAYARCHRICPNTLRQLEQLQQVLDGRGEDADFVIVGYDPETEDAATWRAFRARHGLNRGNWHFLSGSRGDTEKLARQLGFDFWKYDEHVMHDAQVLVFDAHGLLTAALAPGTRDWPAAP